MDVAVDATGPHGLWRQEPGSEVSATKRAAEPDIPSYWSLHTPASLLAAYVVSYAVCVVQTDIWNMAPKCSW